MHNSGQKAKMQTNMCNLDHELLIELKAMTF
jgi:hypothetical protein